MAVEGADQSKYPREQAKRGEGRGIEAKVFREREAAAKADQGVPPRGYATRPGAK